jgi:transcriptional regulator with XRE-family HTH domain
VKIGDRIRIARKAAGLSQEEVARRAGLSLKGMGEIERGDIEDPHISSLAKLARALGVTVEVLIKEEEESALAGKADASQEAGSSAPDPREYDEILIPRSRLTPEVFRGVIEALLEHEHQMEDLSVSMQEGNVEIGLKERENYATKGPDPAVWGSEESRPEVPMPESAGARKHVQIQDNLGEEVARVTITETPFLDIARELRKRRITPEDAWERISARGRAEPEASESA